MAIRSWARFKASDSVMISQPLDFFPECLERATLSAPRPRNLDNCTHLCFAACAACASCAWGPMSSLCVETFITTVYIYIYIYIKYNIIYIYIYICRYYYTRHTKLYYHVYAHLHEGLVGSWFLWFSFFACTNQEPPSFDIRATINILLWFFVMDVPKLTIDWTL